MRTNFKSIVSTLVLVSIGLSFSQADANSRRSLFHERKPTVSEQVAKPEAAPETAREPVYHRTTEIDGLKIFYREAGSREDPTIVLLHGYPTSSHMFRNLMRNLGNDAHLIAPDYPGFGRSTQPSMTEFDYSFENYSRVVEKFLKDREIDQFYLYLMDYGAPIGYRIALRNPDKVQGLIIQNGCAYEEGLETFWDPIKAYWNERSQENGEAIQVFHAPDGLLWQYTHGTGERQSLVSPDNWQHDLRHLERPGNNQIQLALFYDYQTNVPLYPSFQQYFREYQPRTLIVYGKNDYIFPVGGAHAYLRDLQDVEFHLYDTGHFALETHGEEIAQEIRDFVR